MGYAIPPELFAPFVNSAVEVFANVTSNETAIEGFKWAMNLVSKWLGTEILSCFRAFWSPRCPVQLGFGSQDLGAGHFGGLHGGHESDLYE